MTRLLSVVPSSLAPARRWAAYGLLFFSVWVTACDLVPSNPNAATEEEAVETAEGLRALTVGLQRTYSSSALPFALLIPGVTSREVAVNTTFQNLIELEAGGEDLPPTNASIGGLWGNAYDVVAQAELIIDNAGDVPLPPDDRNAILATALTVKAMALGIIAQNFEQGPIQTRRSEDAPFRPRSEVFAEAIQLLQEARTRLTSDDGAAVGPDAGIVVPGLDLPNTVSAYLARYHLFAGNYAEAINAANAVDPDATSTLPFGDQTENPIWSSVAVDGNYAPRDNFGRSGSPSDGDGRVDFYLVPTDAASTPNGLPIEGIAGFFDAATDAIPLFLPGEMPLIRAEARLRRGDPPAAVVAEIDAVRTKTADEDPFGVGAGLPPYDGPTSTTALEAELLRQRRAELFLQGLGLEDRRRLGPTLTPEQATNAGPFTRTRNFYPYPQQERINNPNTPEDPEI